MNTKNKKSNPKISVIITCYNYGKFIEDAIISVQYQTFRDYEIILIDDVVTSGKTIYEAKRTLEDAGYRVVAAIAIAHGL